MSLKTFRDPHVSRWQSMVERVLHRRDGAPDTRHTLDHPVVAAMAAAGSAAVSGVAAADPPGVTNPPPHEGHTDVECAHLALQLATARLEGRPAEEIQRLEDALKFSTCDPLWAEAVTEYLDFFDVEKGKIPYRPAASPDDPAPLPMTENATVALIADWGTGTADAKTLLKMVAAHQPDVLIHLGDVYYSGTSDENMKYFLNVVDEVFGRGTDRPLPVFNLTGNHDMYSGGRGFYDTLDRTNVPPLAPPGQMQTNSFFCLRSSGWQILGLDTGLHDSDVFDVATSMTYLEDSELAWHKQKIATAGGRRTILLSHHQLFSAFSAIGPEDNGDRSMNTLLHSQLADVLDRVDGWFWGHEHNLEIYGPYAGLAKGRCIGCSAVPVFLTQEPYKSRVGDRIPLLANPKVPGTPILLGTTGEVYNHAYVILKLDDAGRTARVSYYQDTEEGALLFEEVLGA